MTANQALDNGCRTPRRAIAFALDLTYGERVRERLMKVRDLLRRLADDGWYLVATEGDHRQLKHPTKSGRVTVVGHPNKDVPPGTLPSILRQAGLSRPKE